MRRQLSGMRMLITGASQGIGKALAELAVRRGCKVLAAARSLELLQELAGQLKAQGHTLEVVQADVTSADDRQKMVQAAQEKFGGLDLLVNNAGIGATGHFVEADEERMAQVVVYRRPLEHRAASRRGLRILVYRTIVEQLSALTGRPVSDFDAEDPFDD